MPKPCLQPLTANYRMWDARMLSKLPVGSLPTPPPSSPIGSRGSVASGPTDIDPDAITDFLESNRGKGALMADWPHQKSVSSAYWDPSGSRIVSTCYDDTIRCKFIYRQFGVGGKIDRITVWNIRWNALTADKKVKTFEPFSRRHHNCQTVNLDKP
jgi:WD repeat-containing protein 76